MKKIAILLSLIVFCLAQNNPRNNQSAVFEQISVVPQQNIVIDIEHSQLHNDSFISLSEYLKENKDNIFNSQNGDSNYDELLDMQNQGLSRNKPTNWNMQNAIQSIDNDSKEIDSNDIPQSLNKLAGDDIKIIPTGSYPAIDVAESNGDLYVVFNYVNTTYSQYKMFYIYKSTDDGQTWNYVSGAYSTAYAFEHPVISVLKDYVIVSYQKDKNIGIYRKDISSANSGSTFTTIKIPNQNNSTINDEVMWGSIITDKFYYDESNTWAYLNYLTYDTQTEGANIYYLVSYDQGETWKTPVAIISQSVWAMRYSISTGYTTPKPYTGVDFLWFTWLSNDRDLYATKVDIYKVQTDPSAATTNIKLIAETDTRNVWHGTVATYFDKIFITGMIYWETGSKTSSNKNADLYMTFSDDGGEKWGTEDYSWYYWKDVLDKQEWRPVATYGTNGVLGFSWTYDGDLYFRTNSTGEYLQGWNPSVASDVNSSGTIFIASAIKDSTFHYAYSPWGDPTDIFYNNKNMEAAQKSNLSGYVTNAMDGTPISNATVNITGLTSTTDQNGYFQIKSIKPGYVNADFASNTQLGSKPLDVQFINLTSDGSQAITISASDFISYEGMIKLSPGKDHTFEYSLTPQLASGEIRAVLNWGAIPEDLDGHLFTPEIFGKEYHVWWYEPGITRGAPFATLDHDDTLSYGPETITIAKTFSGTYSYYVTNYSRVIGATQSNFGDSEATVSIYDDKGKVATIGVPKGSQSSDYNHWKVFTIDGSTGNISLVNELTNSRPDLTSGKIQADDFKKSTINKSISFINRRGKTSSDLYYLWDFGDGNTSTEEAPSHIYETPGKYTVKLESSDGANYSTKTISDYIVVVSNMPPTIFAIDNVTIQEDSSANVTLSATDIDGDALTYSAVSDTNAVTVSVSSSTLTLTPNANWNGVANIKAYASDGSLKDSTSFMLTVTPVSDIATVQDVTIDEDKSAEIALTSTFSGITTFTAVSDTNAVTTSVSSSTLTLTPTANWHGIANIKAYASDGTSKDSTSFKLTVNPVNDAPTAFEWVSSALDTINITQSNLTDTYTLQWGASTDAADGDSINYLIYAKIGVYPAEEVFDTTSTSVPITYQELLENVFEPFPMLPRVTVKITVVATDGIDTVNVTGDDRVLFVNRYEYLSTEGEGVPVEFALHENYPNPFNPTTTLRFDLPEVSDVTLTIYNMLGQRVRTFDYQNTSAGYHSVTWNATNDYGDPVGAGVYLYQLQTKDFVKTRKMVLLK